MSSRNRQRRHVRRTPCLRTRLASRARKRKRGCGEAAVPIRYHAVLPAALTAGGETHDLELLAEDDRALHGRGPRQAGHATWARSRTRTGSASTARSPAATRCASPSASSATRPTRTQDVITEARYLTFGCTSAIAASEALCAIIEEGGYTPIEALKITNQDIVNFLDGLPRAEDPLLGDGRRGPRGGGLQLGAEARRRPRGARRSTSATRSRRRAGSSASASA